MPKIPDAFQDLLQDETRAFLSLATLMPDGTPQVTPVWFNYDGEYLLLNSAKGRVKDRNMRERPHVSCLIMDPENPYRYLELRGEIVAITEEGAAEHINDLMYKYKGQRGYPIGSETRVKYTMRIDRVSAKG